MIRSEAGGKGARGARDRAGALALGLLAGGFGLLPIALASAIGGTLGRLLAPRFYPVAHRRALATMRALRPDLGEAAGAAVQRMWAGTGRVYAELPSEHRLWPRGRVTVVGAERLAAIRASGRPVIAAGLHLGNWEVLPIALSYLGENIVQVYQPQPGPAAEAYARRVRLRAAAAIARARGVDAATLFQLVPPSPTAGLALAAAVRAGWTAMIFADEDPGGRCTAPGLEGVPATGGNLSRIVRLARATGAVILPAFVERTAGARLVVRLLPPIEDADRPDALARLDAALAAAARAHLDQWFMLPRYRFPDAPPA